MGYYDGMGLTTTKPAPTRWRRPRISRGVGGQRERCIPSVLATIQGFLTLYPDNHICGVILNQCSGMSYPALAKVIIERFGGKVRPFGYLPKLPECAIESRHLGLVTAAEITDLKEKLELLAQKAEETLDIDGLLELADSAPPIQCDPVALPRYDVPVRIAVAKDNAFCFYYEDSLQVLRDMGAELVEFIPMYDEILPEEIHGIYLGGGYPELYAGSLSETAPC